MSNFKLGPNQQAWVDELRSTEKKQGTGYLNASGHYCCLGIACDMFKDELDLDVRVEHDRDIGEVDIVSYNTERGLLPPDVVNHLNLRSERGVFEYFITYDDSDCVSLTNLNDFKGASFKDIADFIEEHADAIFTRPV